MSVFRLNFFRPKTLAGRITLIFILLFGLLSLAQYATLSSLWFKASQELKQRAEWGVASRIATQLEPYARKGYSKKALEDAIAKIYFINPRIKIYVLDSNGWVLPIGIDSILLQSLIENRSEKARVPLELLEEFLSANPKRRFPLYGPSIAFTEEITIFSASHFYLGEELGYLYVTLESEEWIVGQRGTEAYYVLFGGGISSVVIFFLVGFLGLTILFFVTRRFSRLTKVVGTIADGDLTARAEPGRGDEIGELSTGINTMADRLVSTIDRLENQDRFRRNFMASVAHDLRTPITSIQGYLQRFEKKQDSIDADKRQEYFSVLLRNTERLDNYVEEIFEASKIEAQDRQIELSSFNLNQLLDEDIIATLVPSMEAKNINLETNLGDLEQNVLADKSLMQRVLMNLLQNAISYTSDGGKVLIEAIKQSSFIKISISDTGIGISKTDLEHIFEPFYRAEKSRERSMGGTGLGLFIVKQILVAHDADIRVESKLGEGTTFKFKIAVDENHSPGGH